MMETTNDLRVAAIRKSVRTSYNELRHLLEGPVKGLAPFRYYEAPAPGEWTIMEILAHIVEFM